MKKAKHIRPSSGGRPSMAVYLIVFAIMFVVAGIFVFTDSSGTARTVSAQSDKPQKKYRGSRAIVKDKTSGEVRLPTTEEVDQMVGSLASLTKQPEGLPETAGRGGSVGIDLEGGFGGTIIARALPDGSFEMRCVFTFEEGAEFLGLVEDPTR